MKILAVFKVPVTYFAPIFKMMSRRQDIDLMVVYGIRVGDGEKYYDYKSQRYIEYGINVLDGYKYVFLDDHITIGRPVDYKIKSRRIIEIMCNNKYDVVINNLSYWSPSTWMMINTAKHMSIPIVTRATVEAHRRRNIFLRILKKIVVGKYCKCMSAGVYECKSQKEYLEYYGMKSESLFFAPCAVDNECFKRMKKETSKEEVRRKMEIEDDSIVILSTSMLVPRKRNMDVLEAFEMLKKKGYNINIIFCGNGESIDEMKEYIKEKHIENVSFTGRVSQNRLSEYYVAADIYVLASENDASPKALNEAMNYSLPIVISDGIETSEQLLEEGTNGYGFVVGDINDLSSGLERIIKNPNREKMGRESARIVGQYSFDRVIDSWIIAMEYAIDNM